MLRFEASGSRALLPLFAALILWASAVSAGGLGETLYYKPKQKIAVFASLSVDSFTSIDGASVDIEYGYAKGLDVLIYDYQGSSQINAVWNEDLGVMQLSGVATVQEYSAALASVKFMTNSDDGQVRQIIWNFGNNTIFLSKTGHYYKYYDQPAITWKDAKALCEKSTLFGLQGYLTTITSKTENDELAKKTLKDTWIAGTDADKEGVWRWMSGPESAAVSDDSNFNTFWQGPAAADGGAALPGKYSRWRPFQPDGIEGSGANYLSFRHEANREVATWVDDRNEAFVPGVLCEYGGMAQGENIDDFEGHVVLKPKCQLFTSAAECKGAAKIGCSWSGSSCEPMYTCVKYNDERSCAFDVKCMWDVSITPPICVSAVCGAYCEWGTGVCNKESCEADPKCEYKNAQCIDAHCTDMTACECASVSKSKHCAVRGGSGNVCVPEELLDCKPMDILVAIEGSKALSAPFVGHADGFTGVMETLSHILNDIDLTGTTTASATDVGGRVAFVQYGALDPVPAGAALSGVEADLKTAIEWHEANELQTEFVEYGNLFSVASTTFGSTVGSRSKVLLILQATQALDVNKQTAANSDYQKLVASGVKVVAVQIRHFETPSAAELSSMRQLKTLFGTNAVTSYAIDDLLDVFKAMCDVTHLVGKSLGVSTSKRCSVRSQGACTQSNRCAWDSSTQMCSMHSCLSVCNKAQCGQLKSCTWSDAENVCLGFVCAGQVQASCSSSLCRWSGTACEALPCVGQPSEMGCIAEASCQWKMNADPPCSKKLCSETDGQKCVQDPRCRWAGDHCHYDVCRKADGSAITNKTECLLQNPICEMDPTVNECVENKCADYDDEAKCEHTTSCHFNSDVAPPVCEPKACGVLNKYDELEARTRCQADNNCWWSTREENGFGNYCVQNSCAKRNNSASCNAVELNCVFKDGHCVEVNYAECPAADVLFIIDGSAIMGSTFGRHAQGLAAIIEKIRSWVSYAPLSKVPSEKGFRVSFAMYMAPALAYLPPDSSSTGGPLGFTGDLQSILRSLDSLEAKFSSAGEAYIAPAVQRALDLFPIVKPTDVPRKRMVYIVSATGVKDGTKVRESLRLLQNERKVMVFATYVRRFDDPSASDVTIAKGVADLATPGDNYFSMSTVDEFYSNQLLDFCDPTSDIGTMLELSLDGDLPCFYQKTALSCHTIPYCSWNANKQPSCAKQDQCANLDCRSLTPKMIANGYGCANCVLQDDVVVCTKDAKALPTGVCEVNACGKATQASCVSTTDCVWNSAEKRCELDRCKLSETQCRSNPFSCTWDVRTGTCSNNECSELRSVTSCLAPRYEATAFYKCRFNATVSPPVCLQNTCPNYGKDEKACTADPSCQFNKWFEPNCQEQMCTTDISPDCDAQCAKQICQSKVQCYWNDYTSAGPSCLMAVADCILSDYSGWQYSDRGNCTVSCSGSSTKTKSRTIIKQASNGGRSCAEVADDQGSKCERQDYTDPTQVVRVANCDNGDRSLTVTVPCGNGPTDMKCNTFCAQKTTITSCIETTLCRWQNNACVPPVISSCAAFLDAASCGAVKSCLWDSQKLFCEETVGSCRLTDKAQCESIATCIWGNKQPTTPQEVADRVLSVLYNPGSARVAVFQQVQLAPGTIDGAVVIISSGYRRGKDTLEFVFGTNLISSYFSEREGRLVLTGAASASEYESALKAVYFRSTSTDSAPRVVTWNLNSYAAFSPLTKHFYAKYNTAVSWNDAKLLCESYGLNGLPSTKGYLATVTSQAENDFINSVLEGKGWLGGSDSAQEGRWQWTTGPEGAQFPSMYFWEGLSSVRGGQPSTPTSFANWVPPVTGSMGEPNDNGNPPQNYLSMSYNGYWMDKAGDDVSVAGFVCEWGDNSLDWSRIAGIAKISIVGCFPRKCEWHTKAADCAVDSECVWSNGVCQVGCVAISTPTACQAQSNCRWDSTNLPATCVVDPCLPLGITACASGNNGACEWSPDSGKCVVKLGCNKEDNNEVTCKLRSPECFWAADSQKCMTATCSSKYGTNQDQCKRDANCNWINDENRCAPKLPCMYFTSYSCNADPTCSWAAGSTTAMAFTPGGGVFDIFSTVQGGPDDSKTIVEGATVAIIEGFVIGGDVLLFADSPADKVRATYNAVTGVLSLVGADTADNMYAYIQRVKFQTTSSSPKKRRIVWTLGADTFVEYKSSTFYKRYRSPVPVTFEAAQKMCQSLTLYGLSAATAQLPSIKTIIQNSLIASKVAPEQFFLSASVTGSGNAAAYSWSDNTNFWNGNAKLGTAVAGVIAPWADAQPMEGNRVTMLNGRWVTSVPGLSVPEVVCEVRGTPVARQNNWGMRLAAPQGCFPQVCTYTTRAACSSDVDCFWNPTLGRCVRDDLCSSESDDVKCYGLNGCYWNYRYNQCARLATDDYGCRSWKEADLCKNIDGCEFNPALFPVGCIRKGCAQWTIAEACYAQGDCVWTTDINKNKKCVNRVCGYTEENTCWKDSACRWNIASGRPRCEALLCYKQLSSTSCAGLPGCMWREKAGAPAECIVDRCGPRAKAECTADVQCLLQGDKCLSSFCSQYEKDVVACRKDKSCYYDNDSGMCVANRCSVLDAAACAKETESINSRVVNICKTTSSGECAHEEFEIIKRAAYGPKCSIKYKSPSLWWILVLLAIMLLMIIAIVAGLVHAWRNDYQFFDPMRYNKQFQEIYKDSAADLINENLIDNRQDNQNEDELDQNAELTEAIGEDSQVPVSNDELELEVPPGGGYSPPKPPMNADDDDDI